MTTETYKTLKLRGEIGRLASNVSKNWLIGLRETNPAILDMFRERDKKPYRELLPWSGEFAGKYITGAYYVYKLTGDAELYAYIRRFIAELIETVDSDGYAGCYSRECRLTGAFSQKPEETGKTWDAWSHYHMMVGLLLWSRETGDAAMRETLLRTAELFIGTFYRGKKKLSEIGWTEMNLAPIHAFSLLYEETGDKKYLDFALEIEKDLSSSNAGDYVEHALAGGEFYTCAKPRWESLHAVMGIAALYRCTGDEKYLRAAKQIFYSILKTDVHNTGGFSTREQAIGNPFENGPIELCCVIAYNALACDILGLTGDPKIADHLERSLYNAVMGSFSPTGRWSTYNTPMEGKKEANYHTIVFQSRSGSPDLNCCSANAARGIGTAYAWALTREGDTLFVNLYESLHAVTSDGLEIDISGDYPADPRVKIRLSSKNTRKIALRVPSWSENTRISLYGAEPRPEAGSYYRFDKAPGETELDILFDFTPRFLKGDLDCAGQESVFVGPVLYGCDLAQNESMPDSLSRSELLASLPDRSPDGGIVLKLGGGAVLRDFYHLGAGGSVYKTWFRII